MECPKIYGPPVVWTFDRRAKAKQKPLEKKGTVEKQRQQGSASFLEDWEEAEIWYKREKTKEHMVKLLQPARRAAEKEFKEEGGREDAEPNVKRMLNALPKESKRKKKSKLRSRAEKLVREFNEKMAREGRTINSEDESDQSSKQMGEPGKLSEPSKYSKPLVGELCELGKQGEPGKPLVKMEVVKKESSEEMKEEIKDSKAKIPFTQGQLNKKRKLTEWTKQKKARAREEQRQNKLARVDAFLARASSDI
jgi:hypothetical protein